MAYNRLGILYAYVPRHRVFWAAQPGAERFVHNVGLTYYETENYAGNGNDLAARYIAYAKVQEKNREYEEG